MENYSHWRNCIGAEYLRAEMLAPGEEKVLTIKEVKTEMANSVKSFNKGRMTEAEHDKEYTELEAELKALEDKLEPYQERDLSMYEDLIKSDWKELYEALNRENKRAFWRKYIKEIRLTKNGVVDHIIFF